MTFLKVALLFTIILLTSSLYSKDSTVVKLTDKNFKSLVLQSNQLWLVEFYAPWCGHCKQAAPEFQKAAEILQGIINVGAVDVPDNDSTGRRYGVSSYPTIKFFGSDKKKPLDFSSSDRTFQKFVSYSLGKAKAEINARLNKIESGATQQIKQSIEQNTDTDL